MPPAGPTPRFSLSLFPYPFIESGPFLENLLGHNVLVLPQDPAEWRDFLQLASNLGRLSNTDVVSLSAMTDRDLDMRAREQNNLIPYGTWGANPVVQELRERGVLLPLQFLLEKGKIFSRPEETFMGVKDKLDIAAIEEIHSPWNGERATLVVSGTSLETLPWAIDALAKGGLSGNLATVTQKTKVTTFDIPQMAPPARRIPTPKVTLPVVGTILVALLIAGCFAFLFLEPRLISRHRE